MTSASTVGLASCQAAVDNAGRVEAMLRVAAEDGTGDTLRHMLDAFDSSRNGTATWSPLPLADVDLFVPMRDFAALGLTPEVGTQVELGQGVGRNPYGRQVQHFFNAYGHPQDVLMTLPAASVAEQGGGCVRVRALSPAYPRAFSFYPVYENSVPLSGVQVLGVLTPSDMQRELANPDPVTFTRPNGVIVHALHGALHRADGGPALHSPDGALQEWFLEGKRHRDATQGPAQVSLFAMVWMEGGQEHRPGGKPCFVSSKERRWKERGEYHREGNLPAFIHGDGTRTDMPGVLRYFVRGLLHRTDGPATSEQPGGDPRDGGLGTGAIVPAWYYEGKLHSEVCPAFGDTWYCHGKKHRVGGPARSGPGYEEWWEEGCMHRVDGPAHIWDSCGLHTEEWLFRGQLHRVGGPACTVHHLGVLRSEVWFSFGVKHRPVADGPAATHHLESGCVTSTWIEHNVPIKRVERDMVRGMQFTTCLVTNAVTIEPPCVNEGGNTVYYVAPGVVGRLDDNEPAVITADGTRKWFHKGTLGRAQEHLPTVEYPNGDKDWYNHERELVRTEPPERLMLMTRGIHVKRL